MAFTATIHRLNVRKYFELKFGLLNVHRSMGVFSWLSRGPCPDLRMPARLCGFLDQWPRRDHDICLHRNGNTEWRMVIPGDCAVCTVLLNLWILQIDPAIESEFHISSSSACQSETAHRIGRGRHIFLKILPKAQMLIFFSLLTEDGRAGTI